MKSILALLLLCACPASPARAAVVPDPEMTTIFKADQADRETTPIDWTRVRAADAIRRKRTDGLLQAGRLRTAEDYYEAAFVFQHGETDRDFLKAHLLAIVAAAKGQADAPWIAAATLDRYLQAIGRPQVLGTQFLRREKGGFTQEPYDHSLASDAMRAALGVPSLTEQEKQRRAYDADK